MLNRGAQRPHQAQATRAERGPDTPRPDGDWGVIMAAARIIDMCQGTGSRKR